MSIKKKTESKSPLTQEERVKLLLFIETTPLLTKDKNQLGLVIEKRESTTQKLLAIRSQEKDGSISKELVAIKHANGAIWLLKDETKASSLGKNCSKFIEELSAKLTHTCSRIDAKGI